MIRSSWDDGGRGTYGKEKVEGDKRELEMKFDWTIVQISG
jgi:hypothetical protein